MLLWCLFILFLQSSSSIDILQEKVIKWKVSGGQTVSISIKKVKLCKSAIGVTGNFPMNKREIKRVSLNYSIIKQATKYHYGHDIV